LLTFLNCTAFTTVDNAGGETTVYSVENRCGFGAKVKQEAVLTLIFAHTL